jgi:hypothetical protein
LAPRTSGEHVPKLAGLRCAQYQIEHGLSPLRNRTIGVVKEISPSASVQAILHLFIPATN